MGLSQLLKCLGFSLYPLSFFLHSPFKNWIPKNCTVNCTCTLINYALSATIVVDLITLLTKLLLLLMWGCVGSAVDSIIRFKWDKMWEFCPWRGLCVLQRYMGAVSLTIILQEKIRLFDMEFKMLIKMEIKYFFSSQILGKSYFGISMFSFPFVCFDEDRHLMVSGLQGSGEEGRRTDEEGRWCGGRVKDAGLYPAGSEGLNMRCRVHPEKK